MLTVFLLASCNQTTDEHNHPELKTGKDYFDYHCSGCHGSDGKGNFLSGIPANIFTTLSFNDIVKLIQNGRSHENRSMPVFNSMPKSEATQITRYLFKLKNTYKKSGKSGSLLLKPRSH